MAGLTKQELAGKTAYLTSSDPAPEKPWVDLTPEERTAWIEKGANPPMKLDTETGEVKTITEKEFADIQAAEETKKSPAAGVEEATPAESTVPAGDAAATVETNVGEPFPAMPESLESPPATHPEHGDLTPEFAEWYLARHGRAAFAEKYKGRESLLPAHLTEGGVA